MKPGSLVECIKDCGALPPGIQCNRRMPKVGDLEVVETVSEDGGLYLVDFRFWVCDEYADELQILSLWFDPEFWREVQEDTDLSFIHTLTKGKIVV